MTLGGYRGAVQAGAVHAAQVHQRQAAVGLAEDAGVAAGDAGVGDDDLRVDVGAVGPAADQVVVQVEREQALAAVGRLGVLGLAEGGVHLG